MITDQKFPELKNSEAQEVSGSQLIFIDPGYLSGIGHYENYARRIRHAASEMGIEFKHYVNLEVAEDQISANELIPFFPYTIFKLNECGGEKVDHMISTFAAKLKIILKKAITGTSRKKIDLFIYTGHPILLPVIAEVLNNECFDKSDITFHFNLFYISNKFALKNGDAKYVDLLRELAFEFDKKDEKSRIQLYADSQRIINVYQRYFSQQITLLPIPIVDSKKCRRLDKSEKKTITLGYLGYTQPKQGYHYLRRLYQDLLAKPEYKHVQLKIRHNVFKINNSLTADLRCLIGSNERVENIVNYQTPSEYESFFQDCDIILIPHQQNEYPVQTSGVLIDALYRLKPVVVPENTWLSDQISIYGSGITFSGTEYEAFSNAVFSAIDNFSELYSQCQRNIDEFIAYHSAENLLKTLLQPKCNEEKINNYIDQPLNQISLLGLGLLEVDKSITDMVCKEKIHRGKNLGWHYILDLVWTLLQLKNLPAGSLVLDAGAGNGLLQYILVHLGFRVISVDFTQRKGPPDIDWVSVSSDENFDNEYVQHLKDNYAASGTALDDEIKFSDSDSFADFLQQNRAKLIYYRADISDMKLLKNEQVDAVVSVSALEHNDMKTIKKAVNECYRVLKKDGKLAVTTSASSKADWYHKASKGWCYSESTLRNIFQIKHSTKTNFDQYHEIMRELSALGNELQVQLAPFYFASGNNGMPWGKWQPEYLPVGITQIKSIN